MGEDRQGDGRGCMKFFTANIVWEIPKNRIPPVLSREQRKICNAYCPNISFDVQNSRPLWEGKRTSVPAWSAVVFNDEISGENSLSSIAYLSDSAPCGQMTQGVKFVLYEGNRAVAYGEIVAPDDGEQIKN